jgi:hypothetical protein
MNGLGNETKLCPTCGVSFTRPKREAFKIWTARRFCSRRCLNAMKAEISATTEFISERFWQKVKRTAGCWVWVGCRATRGYGQFRVNGRNEQAHRVAWLITNGPIRDGLCVLHKCDNRECVRPDHLFLGTNADNTADMMAKGRGKALTGERHPRAKLSWEKVCHIRCDDRPLSQIARDYAVNQKTIRQIKAGRTWRPEG